MDKRPELDTDPQGRVLQVFGADVTLRNLCQSWVGRAWIDTVLPTICGSGNQQALLAAMAEEHAAGKHPPLQLFFLHHLASVMVLLVLLKQQQDSLWQLGSWRQSFDIKLRRWEPGELEAGD